MDNIDNKILPIETITTSSMPKKHSNIIKPKTIHKYKRCKRGTRRNIKTRHCRKK
jgi:hypothetical protein